ncbi:MAG TPA: SDR family NAD(P)-dependent oxidoreductase, partial [Thermoanaerobaculia bacterium]
MKQQLRHIYEELSNGRLSQSEALEKIKALKQQEHTQAGAVLLAAPVWQVATIDAAEPVDSTERHVVLCELPGIDVEPLLPGSHCMTLVADPRHTIAQRYGSHALACFGRLQTILNAKPRGTVLVQVVVANDDERALQAGLSGLLKTAALENPRIVGQLVLVSPAVTAEELVRCLEAERRSTDAIVRYEDGVRQVVRWQEAPADAAPVAFKNDGVYLITGGAGALGLLFAKEILARTADARIVLTGRKASFDGITDSRVTYRQLDLTDGDQVQQLIATLPGLSGILHCAGMIADNFILRKPAAEFAEVLAPKVEGTIHLDEATRDLPLDFFVLFSSVVGAMGNVGQSDYAAANAFMDQFAVWRNRQVTAGRRHGRTRSINWSLWEAGGMGAGEENRELLEQSTGIQPMRTATGLDAFHRSLALAGDQLLVAEGDLARIREALRTGRPVQPAPAALAEAPPVDAQDLLQKTEEYLRRQCAELLKLPFEAIDPQAALEKYGIDSILAMKLTNHLEKSFGSLSKTLFFEYQTIRALSEYFVQSQAARLAALFPRTELQAVEPRRRPAPVKPARRAAAPASDKPRSEKPGRDKADEPIAIVGLSGRYPEAVDLEAYWSNLRDGKDCIIEVPQERWDWREYYSDDRTKGGHHYSKWGGFIAGVDEFDPLFFNISPKEARLIDPQERLFLQHAWMAVEDAGYTRASLQVPYEDDLAGQVGVYVGVMFTEYQLFGRKDLGVASSGASIANRVSYALNLHGPSVTFDT